MLQSKMAESAIKIKHACPVTFDPAIYVHLRLLLTKHIWESALVASLPSLNYVSQHDNREWCWYGKNVYGLVYAVYLAGLKSGMCFIFISDRASAASKLYWSA